MDATQTLGDRLLRALGEIELAAQGNVDRNRELIRRAKRLRRGLESGKSLTSLVQTEQPPRMVELLSSNMTALETAGAEFRAVEALVLRDEGMTIEAVANLFGVSRQRISALLKQKSAIED